MLTNPGTLPLNQEILDSHKMNEETAQMFQIVKSKMADNNASDPEANNGSEINENAVSGKFRT